MTRSRSRINEAQKLLMGAARLSMLLMVGRVMVCPAQTPDTHTGLEEVLRLDGPVKMTARLVRRDTRIGDLAVPAGTKVMVTLVAANRDPQLWADSDALLLDRAKIQEPVAFSRGAHVCIGAPLARAEARVILAKLLEYTSHIDLDREKHPNGSEYLQYEPSFIIRDLAEIHLKLTPARAGHVKDPKK